ncbi:Catabolite control protein [uncultured Ruminococcus sp.]|uniref:LacI family DNA-binding transcriptional regulator n=1 Tax=Massiliimalia timonensis TaxID=1987501 RepID=A0A8J6PDN6_9FIRM|nr:LacI family DNA-binding transcriptional regulator [Massiliimalia timonensis]MBC8610561.1 LacI family DNA-binding transcriptional regulator [Massiliimalia timonensis]SCH89683.1 Catabolite control protein [uncultured Clostridium sp.]SCI22495.1 Catabolite control protein [uncultured Ruminococcus sp.]
MAVTIKQIAELAGVSRGTVDRALNHRAGVKKEVAERILQIAKELNYRPNAVAKALANTNKPCLIGVLMNSDGNEFFDEVLAGIRKAKKEIESFGVSISLRMMKGFDVSKQLGLIEQLKEEGIAALAITPIDDPVIIDALNSLSREGIAVTTLNADVEGVEKIAFVGCDYQKSGQIAGGLMGLFTGGTAKVGVITGSAKMLGHNLRIQGFSEIAGRDFPEMEIIEVVENNDDNIQSYYCTAKLLKEHQEINALYVAAAGVRGAVEAAEVDGRKITILTHDETPYVMGKLKDGVIQATIGQQPFSQGYLTIRTLFDYLMYQKKPKQVQHYTQNEIKIKYSL